MRRLTADHTRDDIYARNMWWNADGTRYLHRAANGTPWPDYWNVIDVRTGAVTHTGLPNGSAISAGDGGFDPVDPNALYYYAANGIHRITLNADGTWSDALYFAPPAGAPLRPLGGTLNWLDAKGRYMLVRYGAEPSVYLYDRQNLAAGPYANPINAANYIDPGSYIGVSPDGQFLVGYQSAPLPLSADAAGKITPWHAYRQEIVAINVVSGEVRRLAHHRSRSVESEYYSTPRLSASWTGNVVGFASNFNRSGGGTPVVDVYAITFTPRSPTQPLGVVLR